MLDWIFEGIVKWAAGVSSELMDTVSGLFLDALGTDMTAMEEYFPFVTKAFTVMQYCSWAVLFLITVWQLFRVFGGPITEAENPLTLIARGSLFAVLIAYAKLIFSYYSGYGQSAIHSAAGHCHDRGGFYLCRCGGDPEQRHSVICSNNLGYWPAAHSYPADCPGLELLQAPAGNRGALCGGGRTLLHFPAGLLHGGL